jgi:DNA polymerase-1
MPQDKKLFLLDAMALIYRAYFAFSNNPRINSKGQNTSAVFGFATTLLEVLKKEKPTHIAVAFDTEAPTSRHEEFSDYKAHRQEIPEDLASNIPLVVKLCEAFNIPVIAMDGYEADDVIGTLAKVAETKGFDTYMMTSDKDFGQLVDEHTFIYRPARAGEGAVVMGVKEVCARWEIENVDQVRDILGLMGDASDNIPGIRGVGEKTAIKLIKEFGSIENLIKNTDKLKGSLKEKVENDKDMAVQSKRLATIQIDVPVKIEPEELEWKDMNRDAVRELFTELEFRRLADQVFSNKQNGTSTTSPLERGKGGEAKKTSATSTSQTSLFWTNAPETVEVAAPTAEEELTLFPGEPSAGTSFKTIADVKHNYIVAQTEAERKALIKKLSEQKEFCFDTETTGTDAIIADIVGMSFSIKPFEAYYVPTPSVYDAAKAIVNEFKKVFEDESISKSGQNLKFDMQILNRYGVEVKGKLFDTMVAHFLVHPDMSHGMDAMSEAFLKYSPISIEELLGKKERGKAQGNMRDVPLEKISEYAAEDADVTLQLKEKLIPMLQKTGVKKVFEEVEMPLIPVLTDMELEGIRLDAKVLKELSGELTNDIIKAESEIQQMAGAQFNVSSPKQVGEILFDVMKISDKPPKTKTGQYSTSEDVLSKMENRHPIIRRILDYRELVKLKNTYVDSLPEMVNPTTGRIHTCFNQIVAVTGRLSSDNPNLQNIPIRTERGREVRRAFIASDKDRVLLSSDYSQIELRIIAELSGDEGMLQAFSSGLDIHSATAAKVYGVDVSAVTSDMRRNAKMVNFGIIYGISAFGLAERLNISRTEAKEIIENYFRQYSGVREYMDESIEKARSNGYVETVMGRRRYLRDINSANQTVRGFAERNAINAPIQGSAADMIKIAMINIHRELQRKKLKSKMVLQVHDELLFDVLKEELPEVKSIVEEKMKTALPLKVPVEVSIGTGNNWLEAH